MESLFGVSTEQVCHRLSTLQRKGSEGVPFYLVRVDQAGNISKRQSATSFHFAKTGGACPLWKVHEAFAYPGRIIRQVAEMPDGQRYFCIALQVVSRGVAFHAVGKLFAIGLGCELQHADRLIYADGLDLNCDKSVDRIGPGCRLCPRQDCSQRAFPAAGAVISTDVNVQQVIPYPGGWQVKSAVLFAIPPNSKSQTLIPVCPNASTFGQTIPARQWLIPPPAAP